MKPAITACLGMTIFALAVPATAQPANAPTPLQFRGKPVNGYLGGHSDFPTQFTQAALCEDGVAASDARHSCVRLNKDGSGTWENDRAPGPPSLPVPIKWYVVADQAGTPTRVSDPSADTWFVILEFTAPYYSSPVGHMLSFPARLIKDTPRRIVIGSKFRTIG